MSEHPYETPRETRAAETGEALDPAAGAGVQDFDPVPLRYRSDGLTPQRQRDYVEALADCGVAREAAGRIGVSEQAINRARRRADARSFDLACEAAARFAARRIRSIAFERAIEGTVRRHYYHGELKSEEVVHDNKLLIYLLGKTEHLLAEPAHAQAVCEQWEPFMEAMEQGAPPPDLRSPWERDRDEMLSAGTDGGEEPEGEEPASDEVWEDDNGVWWTRFPPPVEFDGEAFGRPGDPDYRRFLTDAEMDVMEEEDEEEEAVRRERVARQIARRDAYFGFEGGLADEEDFFPMEAETSETSAGARERSEAARRSRSDANGRPTGRPEIVEGRTRSTSRDNGPVAQHKRD